MVLTGGANQLSAVYRLQQLKTCFSHTPCWCETCLFQEGLLAHCPYGRVSPRASEAPGRLFCIGEVCHSRQPVTTAAMVHHMQTCRCPYSHGLSLGLYQGKHTICGSYNTIGCMRPGPIPEVFELDALSEWHDQGPAWPVAASMGISGVKSMIAHTMVAMAQPVEGPPRLLRG